MEDDLKKIMQPKTIKNKRVVAPLRVTLYVYIIHIDLDCSFYLDYNEQSTLLQLQIILDKFFYY